MATQGKEKEPRTAGAVSAITHKALLLSLIFKHSNIIKLHPRLYKLVNPVTDYDISSTMNDIQSGRGSHL